MRPPGEAVLEGFLGVGGRVKLLLIGLMIAGCGQPQDGVKTVWHEDEPPVLEVQAPPGAEARRTPEVRKTAQTPPPSPALRQASIGAPSQSAATPARRNGDDKGLEVLVRLQSLDLGWTGEETETVAPWPPTTTDLSGTIDALMEGSRDYAQREIAAAKENPSLAFDGFARVRVEAGALPSPEHLGLLLRSLEGGGFGHIALRMGTGPLEVHLPLKPRPPSVEAGQGAGLGFARLRWARSADGHWIDGDVAFSEPQGGEDAPPGARPDLSIGLRSAWSCALVDPEPTFTDAVRRATSALKTFQLPADLPIYVELAEGASFAEGWQLARELRANGHDRVSFLRGAQSIGIPGACPGDARNAAALQAGGPRFLAQARDGEGRVGAGLDFFGFDGQL